MENEAELPAGLGLAPYPSYALWIKGPSGGGKSTSLSPSEPPHLVHLRTHHPGRPAMPRHPSYPLGAAAAGAV